MEMFLLDNVIQHYDWGSHHAIAELQGRPAPSAKPEAELWMGAHPAAPSRLVSCDQTMLEAVEKSPAALLGVDVHARFGGFPFLLKILAAEQPLSIQAHPSKAQAEAGFADEEARGISRSAPHRNYKDANHKPELLCALTRFEALCGFRPLDELLALFDLLALPELGTARAAIEAHGAPEGVRQAFRALMQREDNERAHLVAVTREACALHASSGPFAPALAWSLRLSKRYPGDLGAVSALLLNHVVLEPGQAIYLDAGNLHAYLCGVGVEIMASSDNVLRGGLTSKHVDLPELLRVVDFAAGRVTPVSVERRGNESVYRTPAPDFRLSRIDVSSAEAFSREPSTFGHGPEILLCTAGSTFLRSGDGKALTLARGSAALVGAGDARYTLEGEGAVFRASVGPASV